MAMAKMDRNKKSQSTKAIEEQIKMLQNEDISDRTPIISLIVDKWKHVNKLKKSMTEKYIKNATAIKDAFTHLMKFLSIEDIDELPIVFMKSEEQISSIEMYISSLVNKFNSLTEKKKILSQQIELLTAKKEMNIEEKSNFSDAKKSSIAKLNKDIEELTTDINSKKNYFDSLQEETTTFLSKLNGTYLADYVDNKIILKDFSINEDNIKFIFDNRRRRSEKIFPRATKSSKSFAMK